MSNRFLQGNPTKPDDDENGRRTPTKRITCTISNETGVSFSPSIGFVLNYEIWDENGEMCLFSIPDETLFIESLFSLSGNYVIKFLTDEYYFVGEISIF